MAMLLAFRTGWWAVCIACWSAHQSATGPARGVVDATNGGQRTAFQSVFSIRAFHAIPLSEGIARIRNDDWIEQSVLHWRFQNGMFRIDMTNEPRVPGTPTAMPAARLIWGWNNETWWVLIPDEKSIHLRSAPELNRWLDCAFLFNNVPGPSFAGRAPIQDVFDNAKFKREHVEGSLERFHAESAGEETTITEAVFDMAQQPRLMSVLLESRAGPNHESPGKVLRKIVYHVESWREFDGIALPARAFRDAYIFQKDMDVSPQVWRIMFERNSARALRNDHDEVQAVAADFRPPLDAGLQVYDDRAHLSYLIGSSELKIDGFRFDVGQPLFGEVAPRLPQLMQQARPLSALPPARKNHARLTHEAAHSTRMLPTTFAYAGIGAAIAVGVLSARRAVRRPK
jgi:hypothetical protein